MGLRYRKSVNLGGGFKINMNKSGVGYSFGTKGLRYTKTASGRNRTTASIPSTGISYVRESGGSNRNGNSSKMNYPQPVGSNYSNYYDSKAVENASANTIISEGMEEMLSAAKSSMILYLISFWATVISAILSTAFPLFLILTVIGLLCLTFIRKKGIISLKYTVDDYQRQIVEERLTPLKEILQSDMVWRINQTSKVKDSKYSGGATGALKRTRSKTLTKAPFPFKTDIDIVCFKNSKETLVFLPDKLIIIQGAKIGALDYCDLDMSYDKIIFVESEHVPSDAVIVGNTWKYVNKSGSADKRFKNNKQVPKCSYGLLKLNSPKGVNAMFMFSNPAIVEKCNSSN